MKVCTLSKQLLFCFIFISLIFEIEANVLSFSDKAEMTSPSLLFLLADAQVLWKTRSHFDENQMMPIDFENENNIEHLFSFSQYLEMPGSDSFNLIEMAAKEAGGNRNKHRSSGSRSERPQRKAGPVRKTRSASCCCWLNRGSDDDDDEPYRQRPSGGKILRQCQATRIIVDPDHEETDEAESCSVVCAPVGDEEGGQNHVVEVEIHQIDTSPELPASASEDAWHLVTEGVYVTTAPEQSSGTEQQYQVYVTDAHIPATLVITVDNQDLICSVCFDLMCNPQDYCENAHAFCQRCIASFNRSVCPQCRKPSLSQLQINRSIQRRILRVRVLCPYCQQSQALTNIAGHMHHCNSRPESCAFCRQSMNSDDLQRHIQLCLSQHGNQVSSLSKEQLLLAIQQLISVMAVAVYIPHQQQDEIDQTLYMDHLQLMLVPVPGFPGVFQEAGVKNPLSLFFLADSHCLSSTDGLFNYVERDDASKGKKLTLGHRVCTVFSFCLSDRKQHPRLSRLSFLCFVADINKSGTYKARLELLSIEGETLASQIWILKPRPDGSMYLSGFGTDLNQDFIESYERATSSGRHRFIFRFSVIAPGTE